MTVERKPSSPSPVPTISVVVPCRQAERTLETCLKSLFSQTFVPLEVVVVNDGSTDRTVEIASKFPVVLKNTQLGTGAGAARRVGAEAAQGEIVAFLDSDCEAPCDWLSKIAALFAQDPELGAVGGRYSHPAMKGLIGKLVALEEEYCHYQFSLNPTVANPPGGNFAMRRSCWKHIRTSRELYYFSGMASGEDSVFCEELRQFTKVRYNHSLVVEHHTNEASRYFVRHINRGRSRMLIRLYKLVSPNDNKVTMDAYGGMQMVWASACLWLAGIFLFLSPVGGWFALAAGGFSLVAHAFFTRDYFAFAKTQMASKDTKNRISSLESLGLRCALAVRLLCWAIGVTRAVARFAKSRLEKWSNIALSIVHFWRPGKVSKLFFFVTSRCNARCNFCFNLDNVVNWQKRKTGELTLKEIQKIAKNFGRLPYLTLSGGEPFIRKDLVEVIEAFYTHAHTQWVTIPSNAALTSVCLEKTVQILNRCPNLFLTVQASVDSLNQDHDKSRNIRGGFDKMKETLQGWGWLCRFYPNLRIQLATCYDDFNKDRIQEIIQYCRDHFDVHQQMLYLIRDAHTTITQSNNHLMPSYFGWINDINEYEAAQKGRKNTLWHRTVRSIQKQVSNDLYLIKKDKKFLRPCHATEKFFTLYDDGQVSPCEVLDKTNLGNIRDFNLNYYELKKKQKTHAYYQQTIRKEKCNCDWSCATPLNMLYDPKSLVSIAKNFVQTKPLEFEFARQDAPNQIQDRTYNQSTDTWNKAREHREKIETYEATHPSRQKPERTAPPPP